MTAQKPPRLQPERGLGKVRKGITPRGRAARLPLARGNARCEAVRGARCVWAMWDRAPNQREVVCAYVCVVRRWCLVCSRVRRCAYVPV